MKEQSDFVVAERRPMGSSYFLLVLQHPGSMLPASPGQFVEVLVPGCREVMLRRPISIFDADPQRGTLSLLVQVVGQGTRRLSELEVGSRLNLLYPLGHGFTTRLAPGTRTLLVGGGAGVAPLMMLARALAAQGLRPQVLVGGRTRDLLPVRDEFLPYADLAVATDDGSLGHRGLVTTHPAFALDYDRIYTCGPTPMMKAVARSAAQRGIACEVSLENLMACGVGACLCCVVNTEQGHQRVCKEGPVFDIATMKPWYESNQ